MVLNYNQLIKRNSEFVTAHKILQNFGNGDRWDIVTHNQQATFKYPLMWMEDLPNNLSGKQYNFIFRVYFLELVPTIKERGLDLQYANENEAKSDMINCAQDFIAYWAHQTDYALLNISESITLTTLTDELEDRVTGCYIDIIFEQPFQYNDCNIPMTGLSAPPETDVDITVNGTTFTSVTCGNDYNLVVKDTNGTVVGSKVGTEWIVPAASSSFTYDLYFDGVDTGQNVTVDGTDITINLS